MISQELGCIFVHIPRTGGTSVEDAIWGPDWNERTPADLWMGNPGGENKYQTGGLQHLLATQIRNEVGRELFDEYFKFSFVRNPWDKAVSQYLYTKRRPDLMRRLGMRRWTSFSKYLQLTARVEHIQWQEQWRFVCDESGSTIVDYLGRYESLEYGFRIIAERIGLATRELPHVNRSVNRKPTRSYYTSKTADVISRRYARDIELFEYSFPEE